MKNESNIRIYGDFDSVVSIAAKGTPLPTDLKALAAGFSDLGWLSEDGTEIEREISSKDFTAWQGGTIVRSKITSTKNTVKVTCLEETAHTLGLYYPGMKKTVSEGIARVKIPGGARTNIVAMVVDFFDEEITKRYVISRAEVTSVETLSHKNSDMTMYGFTFTIYGDFEIITNNPAIAAAS